MSDDKSIKDERDRSQIDGSSIYEVDYIAQKYGVTRDKVREAIDVVGNNRDDVVVYLKNRK